MFAAIVLYYALVVLACICALALVVSIVARVVSAVVESRVTWRFFSLFGRLTGFPQVNENLEVAITVSFCLGLLTTACAYAVHKCWLPLV